MTTIKEHGILFSSAMVRAILAGTKTQTRRAVRGASGAFWDHGAWRPVLSPDGSGIVEWATDGGTAPGPQPKAPHGPVGRRLWCRETWCEAVVEHRDVRAKRQAFYRAESTPAGEEQRLDYVKAGYPYKWRPAIHMPRWASRITLEVTRVRVERVGDISEEDARAEGVSPASVAMGMDVVGPYRSHIAGFRELWCEIAGNASWDANPWVWVYDFRRVG